MGKEIKSIVVDDMHHCFVCGSPEVVIHHCIPGTANRRLSEKYHLLLPLCPYHHNMSNEGVHFDRCFDIYVRALAQEKFKENYPDLNFQEIFGKNYEEENYEQGYAMRQSNRRTRSNLHEGE